MDLQDLFGSSMSPLELVARGSLVYVFLFVVFRVVLRRDTGSVGVADTLFIVLIADASQNVWPVTAARCPTASSRCRRWWDGTLADVLRARMERDGTISVIRVDREA